PPDQWYYQTSWQSGPAPTTVDTPPKETGVVVLGKSAAASRLVSDLETLGYPVTAHDTEGASAGLKALLEAAANRFPRGLVVVHAAGLEPLSLDRAGLEASFFSLWETVSALADIDIGAVRLAVVCSGALRTIPSERLPGSIAATMLGMLRVVSKEMPSVSLRFIDTDLGETHAEGLVAATTQMVAADILENIEGEVSGAAWTHLDSYDRCRVLSYRQGQRFEESFSQVSPSAFGPPIQDRLSGRHVVISGGLGGLGLDAAKYLAKRGCSHVTLIGRSGLPSREDWPSHQGTDSRIARRIAAVEALESTGIGVSIVIADVTDAEALHNAREIATESGGPVAGILHTAGTLDDQLIQLKTREDAAAVINPKIIGAVNLVDVFGAEPLEFIVFYSSVSAYLGAPGQADYAAANAFLDSYASDLRSRGLPAVSINWPIWQDVGMAADLAAGRKSAGSGFADFEPRMRGGSYEVCLSTADWILNEHRTRDGLAVVPGTALIHLVHAALAARSGDLSGKRVTINDMSLFAPMTVADGDRLVAAVRFGADPERGDFEIFSARTPSAVTNDEWAGEHVQGRLTVDHLPTPDVVDIETIQHRLKEHPEIASIGLVSPFMNFGDRWNCLKNYWSGDGEMFAELELPQRYEDDLSRYPIHPALLDNAIAGLQSVLHHRDHPGEFLIPMSYAAIAVYDTLPRRVFSHVVAVDTDIDGQKNFDIKVFDSTGRVLIAVRKFAMKVGDARSLEAGTPAAPDSVDLDFSGGISTNEGEAVLETLAGNPVCSQVLVSPVDFFAVLHKTNRLQQSAGVEAVDDDERELSSEYAAPETEVQEKLTAIWKKGLGLNRIGIDDNFFELGGHSLLLTQLAGHMKKELRVSPKTSLLFDKPTIAAWSILAEETDINSDVAVATAKPIKRLSRNEYRKVSQ
ncbi:MAG: SDR family NAD(P)-dependent oxidoreductase, partial [Hyphomicrobiaceae bacterium]